jgi:glutamate synthase domain-containing protein 2/glutamate synthase domain-containing protein 1/glutamate synthase domain-containing protein 3
MRLSDHRHGLHETRCEHDGCGIGAVVDMSGRASHAIVDHGKQVLLNLHHRGAAGSDGITGDGAGILIQIPYDFMAAEADRNGFHLPQRGGYGLGMVFCPRDAALRRRCDEILGEALAHHGLETLGWREVPTDRSSLGELALAAEPVMRQLFVVGDDLEGDALERRLYLARKRAEKTVMQTLGNRAEQFYICSLSGRTTVYKGLFMAHQLFSYYPDLADETLTTPLALVHQRYSTNTFPDWKLAQPFRIIAHNGEINTLAGNANWIHARQGRMSSPLLGDCADDLDPVLTPGGSDSACFDNVLELLVQAGRSLPHAMMMMIPEACGPDHHMSTDRRAFYEYHSTIMEPWDGPAAIVFTDGRLVGGTLDRNGLRPARYVVTTDGLVVLASEVGVIDFEPERIHRKGRLQPGRMFFVDTEEQRIITDREIKSKISRQRPYRRWLAQNTIELRGLFQAAPAPPVEPETIARRMAAFGYTREELDMVLAPMARHGQEPIGSMGNDAALAVLSDQSHSLFSYFKQLFAQVTNPPIDPLREGLVMSLGAAIGKERNLLDETPEHCRQLRLPHPIVVNEDLELLRSVRRDDFRVATVEALFDADEDLPGDALLVGLEEMVEAAVAEAERGASLLVVSDREMSAQRAPIPALLATAAVHHGLLQRNLRAEIGLIVESGEPREVMHFCLLSGFGASAINPYLAFEAIRELRRRGDLPAEMEPEELVDNFIAAIKKGILKTMSRMGISTLSSYHGAQLFEAVGLRRELVEAYFPGTSSRIGGIGLEEVAIETLARHRSAFREGPQKLPQMEFGGHYHYRADGERHLWNPTTVAALQHAAANDDPEAYARFAAAINDQSDGLLTLRGLFDFVDGDSVPVEQVEPAAAIVKRFCTGAMSHGSISREAHETVALAMNGLGAASNCGEGGEDPARFEPRTGPDSSNSAIKQVASARFGVTASYLAYASEIQIKIAQGAKPGEGGQLPGHKVTDEIARLRYSIHDLKCASPGAEVSVKLVSEVGVGTVAAGVAKANADEVLISGHDGGTGASPLSSIKHAGCPWELGLAETQQVLVRNNLRDRIRVQVDGQIRTGRDVVIGGLLGAERFGFGTAALVTLGCCLLRRCHLGTCTAGIATQDPELRQRFAGRPEYLQRYLRFVAEETRQIMARLGFRTFDGLVGRVDRVDCSRAVEHWKARGLDFSAVLTTPDNADGRAFRRVHRQPSPNDDHLDSQLIERAAPAIERDEPVRIEVPIRNIHRTVGALLANRIVARRGPGGLPDDTLELVFRGTAGQSFGAFSAPGMTLRLIGDANDYVGKGLSGGRIVVETPPGSTFAAHDNIIVGNTVLYGATCGEAFINGVAGERFAVRNSGAAAVVEGVGDHGCEYMTGGVVVVLGRTGRNFAAGMSGGIAYVLDERQLFDTLCNLDMVELENVWQEEDTVRLRDLIASHHRWTGSRLAADILEHWAQTVGMFVKVMPIDYRRALERLRQQERRQTETTPATEEVFYG